MTLVTRVLLAAGVVTVVVLLLVPSLAAAVPASALPSVKLPPALARVLSDYETAWQNKDAKALSSLFTEDGFVLAGGSPPVRGRANIENHYAKSGGPLALRALAYATEGSVGYILGAYAGRSGDPDAGKFTLTLRKGAKGIWLIVSDMDNTNSRP